MDKESFLPKKVGLIKFKKTTLFHYKFNETKQNDDSLFHL